MFILHLCSENFIVKFILLDFLFIQQFLKYFFMHFFLFHYNVLLDLQQFNLVILFVCLYKFSYAIWFLIEANALSWRQVYRSCEVFVCLAFTMEFYIFLPCLFRFLQVLPKLNHFRNRSPPSLNYRSFLFQNLLSS